MHFLIHSKKLNKYALRFDSSGRIVWTDSVVEAFTWMRPAPATSALKYARKSDNAHVQCVDGKRVWDLKEVV